MKTVISVILISCLLSFSINAQTTDNNITNYRIFKYSPISLVNVLFPAIQFAYEQNIGNQNAIQVELGGIYIPETDQNYQLISHRTLVEYRWYKSPMKMGKNKFQGFGFRFQKQYQNDVNFILDNAMLGLTNSVTTTGIYYTRGRQKQKKRITSELGASLGIQYYRNSILNVPEGVDESSLNPVFFINPHIERTIVPMAFLVWKIGIKRDR